MQMLGALLVGKFLDSPRMPIRRRALVLFLAICVVIGASWAWGIAANEHYGLDGNPAKIDFVDAEWVWAMLLYLLWGFGDAFVQCWVYWLLGQLSDSPEVAADASPSPPVRPIHSHSL